MTIYQEEMQRKAQHYGCLTDYDEADQLLLISHKGVHLTAVNPEGFMYYNNKDLTDSESREVFSHLVDDAVASSTISSAPAGITTVLLVISSFLSRLFDSDTFII